MSESKSVADVKKALGSDVVELLSIFEKDGNVCLKPKQYLGTDVFKDIAHKIGELGGQYSNGLWRIPLKAEESKKDLQPVEELHRIVLDLHNYNQKEFALIIKKIAELKRGEK